MFAEAVATRIQPPAPLDADEQAAFIAKSMSLAPRFRTELLPPGHDQPAVRSDRPPGAVPPVRADLP